MRALVTGATGFIGSYLTELLLGQGHAVAVLRRQSTRPWRIQGVLPQVTSILGELENPAAVAPQIADFAPDVLFHAAWHGVAAAARNDAEQVSRNSESTAALVPLAAQAGCKAFIALGSQAEYGPQNRVLDEGAELNPTTAYGVAKVRAYEMCRQLAEQTGIRLVWVRVFSVYGPHDNPECMIPAVARKLLRRERPSLTAGEQLWDYLYAEDAAEAIYRVAATPGAEGVFNLGSGVARTIRQIVEQVRDLIDRSLPLGFGEVPYRPDQVMHLQADITRLRRVTGWTPQTAFAVGVARTVQWCRSLGESA